MASKDNDAIAGVATPALDLEMAPIPAPSATATAPTKQSDPLLVAFHQPYDPENPLDWPTGRKWAVTDVLSATAFNRIMVSTIMAPALSLIASELDMTPAESAMTLSIYLLATAFGPLFIGPLSEIYGREVILHASSLWFLIWNIACGFATTKEILIASRFLAGFGASAIYALAGGVLGDIWRPEQRGRSLGVYLLIPLLGAAVGPIIGGFMAARVAWRWLFWATSIFQAAMIFVSIFTFKETYGPLILKRRAARLRRETGNQGYHVDSLDGDRSVTALLAKALSRPLRLLAFHPIIQATAVISAFNYGILYIVLSTFSELWISRYHQSVEISGLHYIACSLGEIVGSQAGGRLMDLMFRRRRNRAANNPNNNDDANFSNGASGAELPEFRLPLVFPGIIIAPLGMLLYGWAAENLLHWAVVDVGVGVIMFGIQLGSMAITAYVIDSYPAHTSSAMAATQFAKSLTAFCFPLFAPRMYEVLGYGWANTSMALGGLLLGIPPPLLLYIYGSRLRAKARSSY
ncbi:hypothetical protein DL764_009392 [Monosporascus ibericus]|uniref:Major facilitator superfamily (MFS) profile domain-containing protein n=1 Tax=Monosporascus ibericus TaxID=155417 RepID=A0A4Q4SXZ5_9PEZI|nr:hypothetical protein DL764_009392 [Monosporascus ibericus]